MKNKYRLSVIIPMYNEDETVVKPLLDSIMIQQNVDLKNDVEVVIVNDGGEVFLSDDFINSYPYDIHYDKKEHEGVSACRNYGLDHSDGEYVMFCDCDDMFFSACGLFIVFREFDNGGFDSLVSAFVEETRTPDKKEIVYVNHDMDSTFVHGKIHNRKYLKNNNIRFNDNLTIHEDSYFNCLCQRLTKELKYCQTPFYLWRWRDESVCRHDPKYILKTYNNMLESSTALVHEFLDRRRKEDAQFFVTNMIYDAYLCLNKDEWWDDENDEYKKNVEKRFAKYYQDFKKIFNETEEKVKQQIYAGIKNRFMAEGMFMEKITFADWIKHIEEMAE